MKLIDQILSTLRTVATVAACYAVYSAFNAFNLHLPTLQEILSADHFVLTKTAKPSLKQLQAAEQEQLELAEIAAELARNSQMRASVDDVCRLTKLGYMVTDSAGRLELCIDQGVQK